MPKEAAAALPKFINIAPDTLDLTVANRRSGEVSVSTEAMSSPMWELIYFTFMYGVVYAKDKKKKDGTQVSYYLAPPPVWLVGIGTLIWQGILQGASWEVVKIAIGKGLEKLRAKGLAPGKVDEETKLKAGWVKYSSSGKKQYEMYISLKKTYRQLPAHHPEAYALAKDRKEFGEIIRRELPGPFEEVPKLQKKTKKMKAKARKHC